MLSRLWRFAKLGVWLILPWICAAAADAPSLHWPAAATCDWTVPQLRCQLRPLVPVTVQSVELAVDGGATRPVGKWQPFAPDDSNSAVLWMVDISDPARAATLARQQVLLRQWLDVMAFRYQLGLASFADTSQVLAPMGSEPAVLKSALNALRAHGQSTAFYRSLLDGLELLKQVKAERKSLWVFSDGMAEDTAYSYEDVATAARAAGIIVIGLGYPERESLRPELQRLQRLAEDTGGYFAAAQAHGNLPEATLESILAILARGGSLTLNLPELQGAHRLTLRFLAGDAGTYEQVVDVKSTSASPPSAADLPVDSTAQPVTSPSVQTPPAHGGIWRLAWILGGLGGGVLGVLVWRRLATTEPPLLARFETADSRNEWPVRHASCRIGRAVDNELRLVNDSVSLHHAELHRRRDGTFSISDLGSTNGIWVNGKRVTNHNLHDGDVLELGEVRLRFREVRQ